MTDRDVYVRELYDERRIAHQRDFYNSRAAEYRTANGQAIFWRNAFLYVSVVAGIVSAALSAETARLWLGLVTAACAATATAITAYATLIGFGPNAKLYEDAAINLDEAQIGLSADLATVVDKVETVFKTENGQWGQLAIEGDKAPSPAPETPAGSAPTG